MSPSLTVDDQSYAFGAFQRPPMSLGSCRDGKRAGSYVLSIPRNQAIECLAPIYDDWTTYFREEEQAGFRSYLGEAGYPSLEDLLLNTPLLTDFFVSFIEDEFLEGILKPETPAGRDCWAKDTIEVVEIVDDCLTIRGVCYRFGDPAGAHP